MPRNAIMLLITVDINYSKRAGFLRAAMHCVVKDKGTEQTRWQNETLQ